MASHDTSSCGICGIENRFIPPLPPRPSKLSPVSLGHNNHKKLPESASSSPLVTPISSPSNSDNSCPLPSCISLSSPNDRKDKIALGKETVVEEEEEEKVEEIEKGEKKRKKKLLENAEKGGKAWPRPITCLRDVKKGTRFSYVSFDEGSKTYVFEKVNIPDGDLLHATREDGRLRLFMDKFSDDDEE